MSSANRTISIPRLLHVARDCLSGMGSLLARSDSFDSRRICVCSGDGPSLVHGVIVVDGLQAEGIDVIHRVESGNGIEHAAAVAAVVIEEGVSVIIGVGGGRVIDIAKLAAARTGIDFVSVPTTLAHDGISSPVASLIDKDGRRRSFAATLPAGIVVDVGVVAAAPARTLRAGVGDLASNLTAQLDWQMADRLKIERYDAYAALLAESAALPALEIRDLGRTESHETLARGLLLSGLAMAAAGTSRPCSGAEHLISHSLDTILDDNTLLHGEQVALGCLVSAAAHRSPLLETLRTAFRQLGLPTDPSDLGIARADLIRAIDDAPSTRPERFTILTSLREEWDDINPLLDLAFSAPVDRTHV